MKRFRDPIHNFIDVSDEELAIIDDPVFQRTRNIKQLSLGNYVYHGAEHSRFGHMLGAMHISWKSHGIIGKKYREKSWNQPRST
ncbi:MAG: hypothetical protein R1F52_03830 [Candidatus Nitrosoabyssus spongiisocia]|nr:MAG: hypothetical protein R1F52_03830 [Nitrosopumilaceae archaeon AB1(1)]